MINSRALDTLTPFVAELAAEFLTALDTAGIEHVVSATFRDAAYQDSLYAIGRTKELTRRRVTSVRGGDSYHQHRVALDVLVLNGKTVADDDDPRWDEMGRIGQEHGFDWGGAIYPTLVDKPHFQYTAGITIAKFKAGWTIDSDGNAVEP
jgi:peptidoglycan LD-endopeptidase CwlK